MRDPSAPSADPALDVLRYERQPLDPLFTPKSVAVIGATEKAGSIGRTILSNLIASPFGGIVFPVSPNRRSVLGVKAYPTIKDVPEQVDLAIVITPAPAVPKTIGECAETGVRGAIIISAGFKESGPDGAALEQQVLAEARRGKMRLIGPNSLGIVNPIRGLNAAFTRTTARPGNVAFVSQSGALCTAILDWSARQNIGFSAFVSIGGMLDVSWGDLIDYLGDDPNTQSILLYIESIGDARSFLSAAREVALTKPIVAIKAGRTAGAARAVASHTGLLMGSDEVVDAAFRRCGVRRVKTIAELFYMAQVLATQPRPRGPRLTIVTNAGGPGVLAVDALIESGGELAELAPETLAALDALLPPEWSHGNPIDLLGDADPDRYAKATEIAVRDPGGDGLLVILTPQPATDPAQTAERLRPLAKNAGKPVLTSFMGGEQVAAGRAVLNQANIPSFSYPDDAVRMFHLTWRYNYNLRGLYETPMLPAASADDAPDRQTAEAIMRAVCRAGRTILDESESKRL
ncbi:MAG TPA: CoA-binding protein, partial [Herpetosiphonaceae bacterium]|nr:CoA-binding protein [Herpetosiphonaceae bacterium]